jgi:hypothetical protein
VRAALKCASHGTDVRQTMSVFGQGKGVNNILACLGKMPSSAALGGDFCADGCAKPHPSADVHPKQR